MLLIVITPSVEGIIVLSDANKAGVLLEHESNAHAYVVDTDKLGPHIHHVAIDPFAGVVDGEHYKSPGGPPAPTTVLDTTN